MIIEIKNITRFKFTYTLIENRFKIPVSCKNKNYINRVYDFALYIEKFVNEKKYPLSLRGDIILDKVTNKLKIDLSTKTPKNYIYYLREE